MTAVTCTTLFLLSLMCDAGGRVKVSSPSLKVLIGDNIEYNLTPQDFSDLEYKLIPSGNKYYLQDNDHNSVLLGILTDSIPHRCSEDSETLLFSLNPPPILSIRSEARPIADSCTQVRAGTWVRYIDIATHISDGKQHIDFATDLMESESGSARIFFNRSECESASVICNPPSASHHN